MTFYDSQLSVLKITDSGGILRDISSYVTGIAARFERDSLPKTTLGDTHRQKKPGLQDTSLDVELLYSEDALVGTDTVLGPLLADETDRDWEYYPRGESGVKYSGSGFVRVYNPRTQVGNLVSATMTLESNSRTRTAP
jgi:hypothetical protein